MWGLRFQDRSLGIWHRSIDDDVRKTGCKSVIDQKEFVPPAPAEPNATHRELQRRNFGYFVDEWCHPAERGANAQKKWHVGYRS